MLHAAPVSRRPDSFVTISRRITLPVLVASTLASAIIVTGCAARSVPAMPFLTAAAVAAPDTAARVQALLPLDALLLGEQHDAPDHQRIHREVIETLAARGALAAVVIEMAMQGNSTASLVKNGGANIGGANHGGATNGGATGGVTTDGSAAASEAAVRAALQWNEQAWPWATYAPAIMAAVRAGVPVMGSNMPRAQMGAAMQQPDLDQRLNGPALKAQQQLIRIGHCNLLPESQISPMTRIQIARDVAMANVVVEAVEKAAQPGPSGQPGQVSAAKTVVLLAGSGHVDRRLGVPLHLPPGVKSRSVLLVAGNGSDAGDRAANFDVVWSAQAVAPQDYCAGLKEKIKG